MKQLLLIMISCLLYQNGVAQSSGTITDIHNNVIHLDSLQGKKVLIMILPLQQDTSIVNQLIRFQNRFSDSIRVIGLVCLSACNVTADLMADIYAGAINAGVVISAGNEQVDPVNERASVLKWLTGKSTTARQTEQGVTGSKYFLSKHGRMYAQAGAATSLDMRMVENIVKTSVPGEN